MTTSPPLSGGFLTALPSPPPSAASTPSNRPSLLPLPRTTPLKPGSQKHSNLMQMVDTKLLGISRRYEKRGDKAMEGNEATEEGRGYHGFGEMGRSLGLLVEVVWVSGTPSLQIPYLLTIALTTCNALPAFSFAPQPTFHLLDRLDLAFYSLLRGADAETGDQLPGFEGGRGKVSTTEKVRLKGIVERTRVAVVEVAAKSGGVSEISGIIEMDDEMTTDDDVTVDGMDMDGNHGHWEMEVARVYEKTIVELGLSLDSSNGGGFG